MPQWDIMQNDLAFGGVWRSSRQHWHNCNIFVQHLFGKIFNKINCLLFVFSFFECSFLKFSACTEFIARLPSNIESMPRIIIIRDFVGKFAIMHCNRIKLLQQCSENVCINQRGNYSWREFFPRTKKRVVEGKDYIKARKFSKTKTKSNAWISDTVSAWKTAMISCPSTISGEDNNIH